MARSDGFPFDLVAAPVAAAHCGWSYRLFAVGLAGNTGGRHARNPQRKRSCILLWMPGGPSPAGHLDLKPGHANGGPFQPINTAVPGIHISEHLPRIAKHMKEMAIIRSLSSKEGDHGRATYLLRTGRLPQGPIQYPSLGAFLSKELATTRPSCPASSAWPPTAFSGGRTPTAPASLGPRYAPLVIGERSQVFVQQAQTGYEELLKVQDLTPPEEVKKEQVNARVKLLQDVQKDFLERYPDAAALSHQNAYDRAVRLMHSTASRGVQPGGREGLLCATLMAEPVRSGLFAGAATGRARRAVYRGEPERSERPGLGHPRPDAATVRQLSQTLDPAWATLMSDLKDRGLLDTTLIVWMGEFGRTPKFPRADGRDHWPNSFSAVLAGRRHQGWTGDW